MIRRRRVALFLALTYGICFVLAAAYALLGLQGYGIAGFTALGTLYMIVPAAVSIILIKLKWKEQLRDYGFRLRRSWAWPPAWVVPVVLLALTIALAALLGVGEIGFSRDAMVAGLGDIGPELAEEARAQLDAMGSLWPLVLFLQALVAGTTINAIFAFGEEMGWRGFLQRELAPLGFWKASALIGAIWGFWHTPLTLMGHNFPENPLLGVPMITLACIPLGILISWVRVRTGSVFAAAIFHGMFNAFAGYSMLAIAGVPNIIRSGLGLMGFLAAAILTGALYLRARMSPGAVAEASP